MRYTIEIIQHYRRGHNRHDSRDLLHNDLQQRVLEAFAGGPARQAVLATEVLVKIFDGLAGGHDVGRVFSVEKGAGAR